MQPILVGPSPLDKLDPAQIPAAERFDWQPKELVGLIGSHRGSVLFPVPGYPIFFSPDSRWLVRNAGELWIWDAKTLVLRHTQHPVFGKPFFSADGKTMAIGAFDEQGNGVAALFDLSGEMPKRVKQRIVSGNNGVHGVALLPDGKSIASGDGHGHLGIYDLEGADQKPRMILRDATNSDSAKSYNIMISPDGKRVGAICLEPGETKPGEGAIRFWDISGAKATEQFSMPFTYKEHVFSALLAPDGKTLFVLRCLDHGLEAYDLTGVQPKLLDRVRVDFDHSGGSLVGFVKDGSAFRLLRTGGLELWQLSDGKLKKGKELPKNTLAASDMISSRIIVSGEFDGFGCEMNLCDATGKKLVEGVRPAVFPHEGLALPFVADGRVFTTTSPFRSWEVKDGGWSLLQKNKDIRHDFYRSWHSVSPDEKLVAGRNGEGIAVIPVQDLFAENRAAGLIVPIKDALSPFCWGPDSKTLFTGQPNGSIEAWDITQKPPNSRLVWKGDGPSILLTASTNGRHLACINHQRKLFLIDVAGKSPPREVPLPEPTAGFAHTRFTPDGAALLATTISGGKVFRFALDQPQAKPTVVLDPQQIVNFPPFELSRDGRFLVWTDGYTLRWYDATTTPMRQLGGWKQFAFGRYFQITPDSRHVLLEQAGMIYVLRIATAER